MYNVFSVYASCIFVIFRLVTLSVDMWAIRHWIMTIPKGAELPRRKMTIPPPRMSGLFRLSDSTQPQDRSRSPRDELDTIHIVDREQTLSLMS